MPTIAESSSDISSEFLDGKSAKTASDQIQKALAILSIEALHQSQACDQCAVCFEALKT